MVRPWKRILLAGCDDEWTSALRYVLRTRGFAVVSVGSEVDAYVMLMKPCGRPFDLLLVVWPFEGGGDLLTRSKEIDPEISTMAVEPEPSLVPLDWVADVLLRRGQCSYAEILGRVRALTARKRGPKPHR